MLVPLVDSSSSLRAGIALRYSSSTMALPFFNRQACTADATATTTTIREKSGRRGIMNSRDRRRNGHTTTNQIKWLTEQATAFWSTAKSQMARRSHDDSHGHHWPRRASSRSLSTSPLLTRHEQVYEAPLAPSRSFPVFNLAGEVIYPEFAYPLRKEIVPIWAAALLAALVPILFFLIMQIRIRSFWHLNNAVLGLLYSLITSAVFQVFLKWLIGGCVRTSSMSANLLSKSAAP